MKGFEPKFRLPSNWNDDPHTKCYTNLDTGDTFCYSEELLCFIDPPPNQTPLNDGQTNVEVGDKSFATEESSDSAEETTPAMKTARKRRELPMRLYYGHGPRIHRQLCIEYGVANKRCDDCGQVGKLTCFSSSFRKWALRRVTEEELKQICSHCNQRGHTSVDCDVHISYRLGGTFPKRRKAVSCGFCGEVGHNRRSCFRAA